LADSGKAEAGAWYALAVLVTLYLVSLIDRSIVSNLIGDIKTDKGLGDFQASLLLGPAFGVAYVLFGMPFGWLSDRWPRPLVIFIGMTLWSLACASGGLATGFVLLALSRSLVGVGEASMAPCAYSLMADLFSRHRLTLAMAIYSFGGSVGGALALLVGGLVSQAALAASDTGLPFIAGFHPWQLALIAVGLPGLLTAFLAFTLPEPRRRAAGPHVRKDAAAAPLAPFLRRNRTLLICHFAAFGVCMMVVYASSSWNPQHLARTFGWSQAKIGSILAALALLGPLLGQVSAVSLVRWFSNRGLKNAAFYAFLCHVVVALPAQLGYLTHSPTLCLIAIFFLYATTSPLLTFGSSALQLYTPPGLRGRLSGAFVSFVSLSGLGVGPALVGYAAEFVFGDARMLGVSLALVNAICLAVTAGFLLVGARHLRRAIAEAELESESSARAAALSV